MALPSQTLSVNFAQGVNTKADPKQVIPGKLLVLENGMFQETGLIEKRPGYGQIGANLTKGGNALSLFKNELVGLDGLSLYSYNQQGNTFINKGKKVAVKSDLKALMQSNNNQTGVAIGQTGNYVYVAAEEAGGVHYSIYDYITGNQVVAAVVIDGQAARPRIVVWANGATLFYWSTSGGSPVLHRADFGFGLTVVTNSAILTLAPGDPVQPYDVCGAQGDNHLASSIYVVANFPGGTNQLWVTQYLSSGGGTTVFLTASGIKGISCFQTRWLDGNDYFAVIYGNSSNVFSYTIYSPTLTFISTFTLAGVTNVQNLVTRYYTFGERFLGLPLLNPIVLFERTTTKSDPIKFDNNFIDTYTITLAGTVTVNGTLARSIGLASKVWATNSNAYFLAAHDSSLQPTYFVMDMSGAVTSKVLPDISGGLITNQTVPAMFNLNEGTNTQFLVPLLELTQITSIAGNISAQTSVARLMLDYSEPTISVQLGNNDNITGGALSIYDGVNVVEQNFHLFPENISGVVNASTITGTIGTGSYQYVETFEWTDAQGQIQRSTPSVPLTINTQTGAEVTLIGGLSSGSPIVTIDTSTGSPTDALTLYVGMGVKGAGIPVNTYLTAIVGNLGSSGTLTLSNNATLTGQTPLLFDPAISYSITTAAGSNSILINNSSKAQVFSSGAGATVNVTGTQTPLFAGMTLTFNYPFVTGTLRTTTIVSVIGNTCTVSPTIASPFSNAATVVALSDTGSTINTDPTITGLSATILNSIAVGWWCSVPNINGGLPVAITAINVGAGTITVSAGASSTTSQTVTYYFPPSYILRRGQKITSTASSYSGIVESVSGLNTFIYGNIIMDTTATAGNTGIGFLTNLDQITLSLQTLRLTAKITTPVSLVLYRTVANGTVFYRVTSPMALIINSTSVDQISYIDTLSDFDLVGNAQLYTTGGEVQNSAPPATSILVSFKNRLIAIPDENRQQWWYSKQDVPGTPIEFSTAFVNNIDQKDGDIEALGVMDDKLVFFKTNTIDFIVGDGPTPAGTLNDFSPASLITTDCGSINKKSIIAMPLGLMFQSAKGIYLLNRALEVDYIGQEVEAYNAQLITSATLMATVNQVRFTLSGGIVLMYDYYAKQWSVFTNIAAVDAVNFEAKYTYLKSNGLVAQETPGTYTDFGAFIKLKMVTAWFSLANLQGFERIRKFLLLGEYKSPHTLSVQVGYNFLSTYEQVVSIPVLSAISPYQFRIPTLKQKIQTLRISIEDSQSSSFGEGFNISALNFEVAFKTGPYRLPAAQTYG